MLCSVIKGPTYEKAHQQLTKAKALCSLAELRLDLFESIDNVQLKKLREDFSIPMIFTLRPISQGGEYAGSEETRENDIMNLSSLKPEYVDLEYTTSPDFLKEFKSKNPKTKIIVSYHDFEQMPSPEKVLELMQKLPADIYKMAFMLQSSVEALSLLLFMRKHAPNVLAMGMGGFSETTRILAPIFGAPFTYANIDSESSTAPGQVPFKVLSEAYHYKNLNSSTSIFGLIGNPIAASPSHFSHNAVFHSQELHSVYVKFPLHSEQIGDFLNLAKKANFQGLSVTIPLKEEVIPFLDEIDPWAKKVGAVNTLLFKDGKIKGFNTDGKGALDAIEDKVKVRGKKIVIMGAGGAAKAIIVEAIDRGASVTILNRDPNRAISLAEKLKCKGGSLEQISEEFHDRYDILINTTPSPVPIDAKWILPGSVVMDIKTQPKYPEFLKEAKARQCILVFGYEMFINQAIEQFRIWFGEKIDLQKAKEMTQETVLERILE